VGIGKGYQLVFEKGYTNNRIVFEARRVLRAVYTIVQYSTVKDK